MTNGILNPPDAAITSGYEAAGQAVWDGLDEMGIGLFKLNDEGLLVDYNRTAATLFGIPEGVGEFHISRIDGLIGSGLARECKKLLGGKGSYVRRGLKCTNRDGRYLELDLRCQAYEIDGDGRRGIVGLLKDTSAAGSTPDEAVLMDQELEILTAVSTALSSSLELNRILKIILTGATASQGLGFNRAFLFLYDRNNDLLHGHMAIGPSSAEEAGNIWKNLESMRLSLQELLDAPQTSVAQKVDRITEMIVGVEISLREDSILAEACKSGNWVNLESCEELDPVTEDITGRLGTRKMAIVPMVSKGNLVGLLAADNFITNHSISNGAAQLLQILANQAAVAMERAELYEALRERAVELERINKVVAESQDQIIKIEKMSVIGELTSAIAHELRNPLTIVGGFAHLMLKADVSEEYREYLNIIVSEIRRAESVLHHVLDFSRASKSESRELDFSVLVKRNLELLIGRLHRPDLDFQLSLAEADARVYGNADQLSHAVYQFLKMVAEELVPPGNAEVITEVNETSVTMVIRIRCPRDCRQKVNKSLRSVFSQSRTSQRLTILVAGETIKYHGGTFGFSAEENQGPSLYLELPLRKEVFE